MSRAPREAGIPPLGTEARELLGYLRDLGWEDFYLDAVESPVEVEIEEPEPAAEPPAGPAPCAAPRRDISSCGDLEALADIARTCEACALAKTRNSVVFGSGSATARVMACRTHHVA